jgi:uncharacterized protein (TIGR03437 family)
VAPGSIILIKGTGLSDVTDQASTGVLPLNLGLATVSFDVPAAGISEPAHIIAVSPTQIVAQVPWELAGQSSAQVKVTINCSYGNVVSVPLADYAPAWLEVVQGSVWGVDANSQTLSTSNPAQHGQAVTFFANGLGPETNQPASGDPGPSNPASRTTTAPTVTIGDQAATVVSSGLDPGVAGRYQVTVTVPPGLSAGTYPVSITIGGQTSRSSNLAVE